MNGMHRIHSWYFVLTDLTIYPSNGTWTCSAGRSQISLFAQSARFKEPDPKGQEYDN